MMVNLTIRLEEEEKKYFQELAKSQDITISQLVRKALREQYINVKEEC